MLLVSWCSCTSGMSPKVECSEPSTMVEGIWVGGFERRFEVGLRLDGDAG
jgi:hypothetical protein